MMQTATKTNATSTPLDGKKLAIEIGFDPSYFCHPFKIGEYQKGSTQEQSATLAKKIIIDHYGKVKDGFKIDMSTAERDEYFKKNWKTSTRTNFKIIVAGKPKSLDDFEEVKKFFTQDLCITDDQELNFLFYMLTNDHGNAYQPVAGYFPQSMKCVIDKDLAPIRKYDLVVDENGQKKKIEVKNNIFTFESYKNGVITFSFKTILHIPTEDKDSEFNFNCQIKYNLRDKTICIDDYVIRCSGDNEDTKTALQKYFHNFKVNICNSAYHVVNAKVKEIYKELKVLEGLKKKAQHEVELQDLVIGITTAVEQTLHYLPTAFTPPDKMPQKVFQKKAASFLQECSKRKNNRHYTACAERLNSITGKLQEIGVVPYNIKFRIDSSYFVKPSQPNGTDFLYNHVNYIRKRLCEHNLGKKLSQLDFENNEKNLWDNRVPIIVEETKPKVNPEVKSVILSQAVLPYRKIKKCAFFCARKITSPRKNESIIKSAIYREIADVVALFDKVGVGSDKEKINFLLYMQSNHSNCGGLFQEIDRVFCEFLRQIPAKDAGCFLCEAKNEKNVYESCEAGVLTIRRQKEWLIGDSGSGEVTVDCRVKFDYVNKTVSFSDYVMEYSGNNSVVANKLRNYCAQRSYGKFKDAAKPDEFNVVSKEVLQLRNDLAKLKAGTTPLMQRFIALAEKVIEYIPTAFSGARSPYAQFDEFIKEHKDALPQRATKTINSIINSLKSWKNTVSNSTTIESVSASACRHVI
jgi:hypothetical protein